MLVVIKGDKSTVYPHVPKEDAITHFEQAVLEGEVNVLWIEGDMVERLTDGVGDDEMTEIVEWTEVARNFNTYLI